MVDVEKRQLRILLAQNEEEGVAELEEFGEVIPPDGVGYLEMR